MRARRCRIADVLALWTEVTKTKPIEDRQRDPETGRMIAAVDNIQSGLEHPTGTSAAAVLRRFLARTLD